MRGIFAQTLNILLILFRKRFTLTEYGKKETMFFSFFGPKAEEQIKLASG